MKEEPLSKETADLPAMFGTGTETNIDARILERHVESAAAAIKTTLEEQQAEAGALGDKLVGGAVTYSFGIATLLYGMWVKDGSQAQYQTSIPTFDLLNTIIGDYDRQGFSPIDLVGSGQMWEPWTVLVAPKRQGYYWMVTSNVEDFRNKDKELFDAGFRIVSFNRRHGNFNATWRHTGSRSAQWIRWDMDYFGLLAWDNHYRSQGLRIAAIDRYGDAGTRYAAVWQPGEGPQIIEAAGGLNYYFGQPSRLDVFRYQDRNLHVRAMGHCGYPVVAFRPTESQTTPIWYAAPPSYFRTRNTYLDSEGYRLSMLCHGPWHFG